jgi:hypothetical protein
MKELITKHLRSLIIIFSGLTISILFIKYPAPHERILNIQNYLITVGGILSAFAISYLAGKIFAIRSERLVRQNEINIYSDKVTAFRKILYYTLKSDKFWVKYSDIRKFKIKYPNLNYAKLRGIDDNTERAEFWLEEKEISQTTISLYTAMEAVCDEDNITDETWMFDRAITFDYTLEQLSQYYGPCNSIWYHLESRFAKHGAGFFNDTGLSQLYVSGFNDSLPKIDLKYRGKEFNRLILAEIGAEMYEIILPKLHELINLNIGIPKSIVATFRNLLYITCCGVIIPIILQSLTITDSADTFLTLSCVLLTILSIIKFVLDFYFLLINEVNVDQR